MTTVVLLILIAFVLVASASLLHALNHAVDGYEDESGFHQGAVHSDNGLAIAVAVRVDDHDGAWVGTAPAEHLPHQIPGKPLGAF